MAAVDSTSWIGDQTTTTPPGALLAYYIDNFDYSLQRAQQAYKPASFLHAPTANALMQARASLYLA